MLSLFEILKESFESPKAIILAGAPGAGKGYVLKGLDLNNLQTLNLDTHFIDLLKRANVSLDLKKGNADSRSKSAFAMRGATALHNKEKDEIINNRESFILDGTGASYKNTLKLKDKLEDIGYDVLMLYVHTDLENSLRQNQERFAKSKGEDRSLLPPIVMKTWNSVTQNYKPYKELFGNNFVSVANTLEDESLQDISVIIKKYLDPFKPTDVPTKDPKSQIRSAKSKAKLNQDIKDLFSSGISKEIINNSLSKEEAQSKIKQFLN